MKKVLGYIISLVGVLGVAAPLVPQIYEKIPVPEGIPDLYFTIGGVVLVAVGLALLVNRGGRKVGASTKKREVPIYEGKDVVGYRRQ